MKSFLARSFIRREALNSSAAIFFESTRPYVAIASFNVNGSSSSSPSFLPLNSFCILTNLLFRPLHVLHSIPTVPSENICLPSESSFFNGSNRGHPIGARGMSTEDATSESTSESTSEETSSLPDARTAPRVKFKRLDKTARHIMQILDKESVEEVKAKKEIPDLQPGHIVELRVEVPENKRRVSTLKGVVIARRNAGLNTTFRLRRIVAGVGVETVFPLYSPNIREIKVLDKKKVRRAKLYYLRDRMNILKKKK